MDTQNDRVYINIDLPDDRKIIITWEKHVRLESKILAGTCLGVYNEVYNFKRIKVKIVAPISGKVIFFEPPGHEVSPLKVCMMEKCRHDVQIPKISIPICSFCGERVIGSKNDFLGLAHQDFIISSEKARELYEELELKALNSQKLFLILDLDNTLIHAEPIHFKDRNRVEHRVQLGFNPDEEGMLTIKFPNEKFVVKLRPFLQEFLAQLNSKYLVFICTKGDRNYAKEIIKRVDPQGLYLSEERLISRDEMKQNKFKSIQKVIHDGSLALILDDRSDVWGDKIKNLVYTNPYNVFEKILEKLMITRKTDVFLYMIKDLMQMVHELFYLFYARGIKIKVAEIYEAIKRSLFANEKIAFFRVFKTEQELKNSKEFKILRALGALSINLEPTNETTLIFAHYDRKIKDYPTTDVPTVSLWYIYYCEMYCTHLDPQDFDVRHPDGVVRTLENSRRKSKEENNAALDQMEEYLRKNESNKGGFESIRDVVIRKLEEKNKEKEVTRDYSDENDDVLTKKMRLEITDEAQEKEISKNVDNEGDHKIENLGRENGDGQDVLDKDINLVQNGLND